jgi:hypothetical protein
MVPHRILLLLFFLSGINAQIALPTFQGVHKPHTAEASSLYDFTTHTFTNCGATGRDGPTLANCTSSYSDSWTDNTSYFNVPSDAGIQYWTVPETGTYTIEAWGASGARDDEGFGARMRGDFTLTSGEIIRILVGQSGGDTGSSQSSGGGGTFVIRTPYNNTASILVIAGGGGNRNRTSSSINRSVTDATTSNDGRPGYQGGSSQNNGGTNGSGGTVAGSNNHAGGSGAGFSGDGEPSLDNRGSCSPSSSVGALAFTNGGTGGWGNMHNHGGACDAPQRYGGFGGGASGGHYGCGAGGGYSGGGGEGYNSSTAYAGGGGSYNSDADGDNSSGVWQGHGKVTITKN